MRSFTAHYAALRLLPFNSECGIALSLRSGTGFDKDHRRRNRGVGDQLRTCFVKLKSCGNSLPWIALCDVSTLHIALRFRYYPSREGCEEL